MVRQDSVDLNDRIYQPPLIDLPRKLEPTAAHRECIGNGGRFLYEQDIDARCTGIATANVVDLLRIRQMWDGKEGSWDPKGRVPKPNRVSAVMLYRMGQAFDELLDEEQHGSTLRGVLRGFQQNGVCLKDRIEDTADPLNWVLTIERCKQARNITLGAYARLQRALLDFQTALKEVGAVVVSARIHSGWDTPKGGAIDYDPAASTRGASHAFVLIGYDDRGFLVLNSRGKSWSSWVDGSGQAWEGVALWHYEDWRTNLLDAWVIRLGVPYANEGQALAGLFGMEPCLTLGRDQAQGVTRIMIQGHYLHTRDGQFVRNGVFVSDKPTVEETTKLLSSGETQSPYRQLVLFVESGLGSMKAMAERAAIVTAHIKATYPSIFPLFIIWREDVQELVIDLLNARSRRIHGITGGLPGATMSHLVRYSQDWLQPVWRTLEGEAERVFQDDASNVERGIGWWAMNRLLEAAMAPANPMTIHFIVHSSGVVWLSAFAQRLHREQASLVPAPGSGEVGRITISSIDLLAPIATMKSVHKLADDLWAESPEGAPLAARKPIRVFTLPIEQEEASRLGGFEGSFLELARRAFPIDGSNPTLRSPNQLAGFRPDLAAAAQEGRVPTWLQVEEVENYTTSNAMPEHADLMNDNRLIGALLKELSDDYS